MPPREITATSVVPPPICCYSIRTYCSCFLDCRIFPYHNGDFLPQSNGTIPYQNLPNLYPIDTNFCISLCFYFFFSSSLFFKSKLDWFATSFSLTCYFYYQLRSIQIRHEKILQCWELNIKNQLKSFISWFYLPLENRDESPYKYFLQI